MDATEAFFVETIEKFPCLWNLKDPGHKNKVVVEGAWTSVASIVNDNVEQCQENWKSIRLKYLRERKLVKEMPSGSASYTGNWELFQKMGFLAPHIQIRKTKSNYALKRMSEQAAGPSKVWKSMEDEILLSPSSSEAQSLPITPEPMHDDEEPRVDTPTRESNVEASKVTPSSLRQKRNQELRGRKTDLTKMVESVATVGQDLRLFIRQNQNDPKDNIDPEDYHYALSLAGTLSKIKNNKKKLLLKAKFLTMAAEEMDSDDQGGLV